MVRVLVVIGLNIFIIAALSVTIYFFVINFYRVQSEFIQLGSIFIVFFSALIVFRYMFLLLFSLLKIIQKTADGENKRTFQKINIDKKVTIIVPAYNEELIIYEALVSLLQQNHTNLEILVIDDGSTDQTYKIAKQFEFSKNEASLKVLRKRNAGKAYAINYGIGHSTGEFIMVVDADSTLEINAVSLLVEHFTDSEVGAVAGSVVVDNTANTLTKLQSLEYIQGLNLVKNGQAFLKMVNIIPGPIGMFRKDALIKVGLYENDTFAEDCDITLKLMAHGYKIDYEMDAFAYTEAPENLLDLIKQRYRWTRGILQSIRKHKKLLWGGNSFIMTFTLWYMLFESVFWPFVHVWVGVFIIYISLVTGAHSLIFFWWLMFTILDMAGSLYCVLVTKARLTLVFYSIYYRIFYIQIINVAKIFSTLEEFLQIKMDWGKLERKTSK